jgi:hypothetical protein
MGDNGDIVCCGHSDISMRPEGAVQSHLPCGWIKYAEKERGKDELGELQKGRKTHEATLINSVKPPNHITSGWMIAKDRFSINFLKPYLSSAELTSEASARSTQSREGRRGRRR